MPNSEIKFQTKEAAKNFVASDVYTTLQTSDLKDLSLEQLYLLAVCAGGVSYPVLVESSGDAYAGASSQVADTSNLNDKNAQKNVVYKSIKGTSNPDQQHKIIEAIATRLTYGAEATLATLKNADTGEVDLSLINTQVNVVLGDRIAAQKSNVEAYEKEYKDKLDAAQKDNQPTEEIAEKLRIVQSLLKIITDPRPNISKENKLKDYSEVFFAKAEFLSKNRDSIWQTIGKVIALGLVTLMTAGGYAVYAGVQAARGKSIVGWTSDGKKFVTEAKEGLGNRNIHEFFENQQKDEIKQFENKLHRISSSVPGNTYEGLQAMKTGYLEELGRLVESLQNKEITQEQFVLKGEKIQHKIVRIDDVYSMQEKGEFDKRGAQNASFDAEKNTSKQKDFGKIGLDFLDKKIDEQAFSTKIAEVTSSTVANGIKP
jgi:hypothetical protein